jgi:hypothetical protein
MADRPIGQKDETAIVRSAVPRIARRREREIALLPDCLAACRRARVAHHRERQEVVMKQWIAVVIAVMGFAGAGQAYAQDRASGPGTVVVTLIPGGATFFTEGEDASGPSFGNYGLGAGVEVEVNRYIGVEGEVTGALGLAQDLELSGVTTPDVKTPNLLNYSGNLVVSAPNHTSVVPYVTGGVGGLTLFEKSALDITGDQTFLTGNVGGGVKWFHGRWGVRGDYRFIAVRSNDDAPAFFGRETRYGHRIYGGVLLNTGH